MNYSLKGFTRLVGMAEEGETRKIVGKINYIGEIKPIGKTGKFLSLGIKLENDEEWHNITGFSKNKILEILGDRKIGENVELTEVYRAGYWNVTEIKNIAEVIQAPVEPIEMQDAAIMKKCLEDAKKIVKEVTKSEEEINYLTPEIVTIALSLFNSRIKRL